VSECGSEITVTPETFYEDEEEEEDRGRSGKVSIERKSWSSSSASGLFVRDRNEHTTPDFPRWDACVEDTQPSFQITDEGVEAADVAEEIMDAVCRFSRRCNRYSAPLRISLSNVRPCVTGHPVWRDAIGTPHHNKRNNKLEVYGLSV
jgi:hypothetical protein